jgi:hypothetical protein
MGRERHHRASSFLSRPFILRVLSYDNALPKEVIVSAIVDLRPVDFDLAVARIAH